MTEELKAQEYCDRSAVPLTMTMTIFLRMELVGQTESFRLRRELFGSDCDKLRYIQAEASRQQLVPGDPVPIERWCPVLLPEEQTQPAADDPLE